MAFAEPLTDGEIERRLSELDGWTRTGDEISRTFGYTYHQCVPLAVYVAAKARGAGHHPYDIRWQRIRSGITTHDAGHRITDLDFALARHIDAIAAGHGATPVPAGDAWLPRPGRAAAAAPLMPALHTAGARRYSSTFMSLRSSDPTYRPWAGPRGIQDRSARTSRLIVSCVVPAILALSRVRGNRRPVFVLADPPTGLPLMPKRGRCCARLLMDCFLSYS